MSTELVRIDPGELPVGRVTTVVANRRALCVARTEDGWGVLDNRCPHQGGPLGEGRIEDGFVVPIATGGASILSSTSRADGFVLIPEEQEG